MPALQSPTRPGLRGALKMTYSPFLNRAALTGREALTQMTDDLRVLVANNGGVLEADLELMGWLPAQISRHGQDAARCARAESADRVPV